MEKTEPKTYKLYKAKLTQKIFSKNLVDNYTLIPTNMLYLLAYMSEDPGKGFKEIPESALKTEQERSWLVKVKTDINVKYMKAHESEMSDFLNKFLDVFEENLRQESEKAKNTQMQG